MIVLDRKRYNASGRGHETEFACGLEASETLGLAIRRLNKSPSHSGQRMSHIRQKRVLVRARQSSSPYAKWLRQKTTMAMRGAGTNVRVARCPSRSHKSAKGSQWIDASWSRSSQPMSLATRA